MGDLRNESQPPYPAPPFPAPPALPVPIAQGFAPVAAPEFTGKNVNYYTAVINNPKRLDPYTAECEDIIEALGMTFAEGCAFKAIWRSCAMRTLGLKKKGQDQYGVYDAEKVVYYGERMLAQRQLLAKKGA